MLPPINLWGMPPMKDHPTIRQRVLDEAYDIVSKDRASSNTGPEDSFKTISGLWSSFLDKTIKPSEVAIMLGLLKIARLKTNPTHKDSWVDLAGYAACGAECELKEKEDWQLQQYQARLELEEVFRAYHGKEDAPKP